MPIIINRANNSFDSDIRVVISISGILYCAERPINGMLVMLIKTAKHPSSTGKWRGAKPEILSVIAKPNSQQAHSIRNPCNSQTGAPIKRVCRSRKFEYRIRFRCLRFWYAMRVACIVCVKCSSDICRTGRSFNTACNFERSFLFIYLPSFIIQKIFFNSF